MLKGSAMAKDLPTSPLAPAQFPNLLPVAGVEFATTATNSRYKGRDDLLLAVFAEGTEVAGVFTRSKAPSAAVDWCRAALGVTAGKGVRALVVNAGNANAFTGRAGKATVEAVAAEVAATLGCAPHDVMQASTGVIGNPLDPAVITAHLPMLAGALGATAWDKAANAIRTTDTFPKGSCRIAEIDGYPVVIDGIAKGSGMIAPDMATMLSFVFTNAAIPAAVLQDILAGTVDRTFNCITVDSDTSTSDTLLAFATGQNARHQAITSFDDPRLDDFKVKFEEVLLELAHLVVKDGEGAEKFVTIRVSGAEDDRAARKVGLAIANSPLIKTAIAGADANWGRVVMAVGKSGEAADRDKIDIDIGGQPVTREGMVLPDYDEARATEHFKTRDVQIDVALGIGTGKATVWTCDLTHGYISINADYRS
ncbi:bifunctional glutamate N-acetyltransferase/amino-acid acetyltransferase ArgJ [Govanella unica]|uniref:Arginine biosynthesis bifunctional protein ArgJ n=1 Tax=Govanella unica TaxID=2975056 RepID=A0A9X3Z5M0_9PROT|nr:bifunctional glutamate N-acetyltransferase/amino-acid acetyltransferase ArgJ [Govania unica]MDA5192360.1 bifunctional glutamate N-acetyltransferase/amino-acid acetyltransferase ArgJ [Govania unica]